MNPQPSAALDRLEVLESRFALRVAARLSEDADNVPADIGERLRFTRERALQRAREVRAAQAEPVRSLVSVAGAAALLGGSPGRWFKVAALVPLGMLVVGLVLIEQWHGRQQVDAAAEIDAALLADDLPPRAYADPAFLEFLKAPGERQ